MLPLDFLLQPLVCAIFGIVLSTGEVDKHFKTTFSEVYWLFGTNYKFVTATFSTFRNMTRMVAPLSWNERMFTLIRQLSSPGGNWLALVIKINPTVLRAILLHNKHNFLRFSAKKLK